MEKYSKAVREMYSQFKQKEAHPAEKYVGRLARCTWGEISEIVGYSTGLGGVYNLIADCPTSMGWTILGPNDVVFKECEHYWYVSINDLID
nr:MAG TPA: hypothetical protein [Caudoviricetes sp.]